MRGAVIGITILASAMTLLMATRELGWDHMPLPGIEQEFGPMPDGWKTPNAPYDPYQRIVPI